MTKNTIEEYCPYCESEIGLERKFIPQKCNCGETLLPCAQCHQLHSVFGCFKCPFEIENKIVVSLFKCGLEPEVILVKEKATFEDFYILVEEYKTKYNLIDANVERFFLCCNIEKKEIYSHMQYDLYLMGETDILSISIEPIDIKYS